MMNTCDVLMHLNEVVEENRRYLLEGALRDTHGVVSSHLSPYHDHLMFVTYDTHATSAAVIVEQVNKQGYHAQIVGI